MTGAGAVVGGDGSGAVETCSIACGAPVAVSMVAASSGAATLAAAAGALGGAFTYGAPRVTHFIPSEADIPTTCGVCELNRVPIGKQGNRPPLPARVFVHSPTSARHLQLG